MPRHSSHRPDREVELKLAVPEAALDGLFEHAVFRRDGAAKAERRHQVTTYFDTDDRALSACKVSLRVRRCGGRRVQTLKADEKGGVAADRAEWEWPIKQNTPDLGLLACTPIAAKLPSGIELQPVVVTEIKRTVRVLNLDGGAVVEAVLDSGMIIARDKREPVSELELRAGEAASLFRVALELHAAVPLRIESESKAARGYRLLTGAVPASRKGGDVALQAATTGADAFRQIMTEKLGHLLVNQPAALAGDAEGVHQMRVAIRQLRAALALFQPLLEPHTETRFQDDLRRIGRVFGEAWDWDVFTLQILPETLREAGAELLRQPAMARREAALRPTGSGARLHNPGVRPGGMGGRHRPVGRPRFATADRLAEPGVAGSARAQGRASRTPFWAAFRRRTSCAAQVAEEAPLWDRGPASGVAAEGGQVVPSQEGTAGIGRHQRRGDGDRLGG